MTGRVQSPAATDSGAGARPRLAWWAALLLMLGGLGLAMALAEVGFRTLLLQPKVPRTEAAFQQRIAAGWPQPVAVPKPPGTLRIVGLSDSFGEAGGPDNYLYRLAEALRRQGWPVEMVNLSLGEFDLEEEQLMLSRWAARYQPDLVLHGFTVANDFYLTGHGELMTWQGISVRQRNFWVRPSPRRLMLLVWLSYYLRGRLATRPAVTEDAAEGPGTYSVAEYLRIEHDRFEHCALEPPVATRWAEVATRLDRLVATARAMGARYALVIHPDEYQVDPTLRERVLQTYHDDPAAYDFGQPQRWLTGWAAQAGVPAIDLLPDFRAEVAEGLYRPRDTHYNDAGNALAAGVIARQLPQVLPDLFPAGEG